MAINKLEQLCEKLNTLFVDKIVQRRLSNDQQGRVWALKELDYSGPLKLESLKEHVERDSLNSQFVSRYMQKDVKARKGISALKVEISALYSFSKCFVQRYKGRMHFYRDDLSQKGKRTMREVGKALGLFKEFKQNLDQ
jgi:hypothetical protein